MVHTHASTTQLGSVISQNNRPLAFYSRKLSSAQKRYTTRELELLSIVETLKEFKNILFGHKIEIWTDHKNLVHETLLLSSDRVMRWRLLLEEYNPTIKYIEGKKNIIADFFSRHDIITDCPTEDPVPNVDELATVEPVEMQVAFPMVFENVRKEQQLDIRKHTKMRL